MAFYEAVGAVPSVKVGFLIVFFHMATGKKAGAQPKRPFWNERTAAEREPGLWEVI